MKKLIVLFFAMLLVSCNSHKVFTNYDLSYSRSGGYAPIYENLLINGSTANYFYEAQGKKYSKRVNITNAEKQKLYDAINKNDMKSIREDIKKVYDNITTTVKMKRNGDEIFKDDGSFIVPEHQQRWDNIVAEFENFIVSKNLRKK